MNVIEISYTRLKNQTPSELKISFTKWFKKYTVVRITSVPLVNFQTAITHDFLRKVMCIPRIQMTEINMAMQYFDLALRGKNEEPISPLIVPPMRSELPSLQKHPKVCDSGKGKSGKYGEFMVIEWDKNIEVSELNDHDIKLIREVKDFVKLYPHHTSQGFDSVVKMHSATYASLGCFIASYLTSCDYQITENETMQKILNELIASKILDASNRVSLEAVNFLHANRALIFTHSDVHLLDHHIIGKLGTLTLNNRVNELAKIEDIDVVHQICALVETCLLVAAPFIYLKSASKNNQLISFKGTQVNNDTSGYNIGIETVISEVLNSMVLTMNSLNVPDLLNIILHEYITSNDQLFAITQEQVKALYDILLSFRQSINNSCIEYETNDNKQHLTVLYPKAVDGHNVTFDPRWSGCNCGVRYDDKNKAGVVTYDLLYDTEEFVKYQKKLGVHVKNERFVVDLTKIKTFLKWRKLILKELAQNKNTTLITPYMRALNIIKTELTEPVMSKHHYSSKMGSESNNTQLAKFLDGDVLISEQSFPAEVFHV